MGVGLSRGSGGAVGRSLRLRLVLVVSVLVVLSATLLLGLDRIGGGEEEGEDHKGQKDELVVEDEHCDRAGR